MDKFLYFQDGNNDAYCYPVSNLISIIHDGDTSLKLFFAPASTNDANDTDLVTLTITTQTEKAVTQALIQAINGGPHTDGFIVVCDLVNSVFLHPDITSTALTADS